MLSAFHKTTLGATLIGGLLACSSFWSDTAEAPALSLDLAAEETARFEVDVALTSTKELHCEDLYTDINATIEPLFAGEFRVLAGEEVLQEGSIVEDALFESTFTHTADFETLDGTTCVAMVEIELTADEAATAELKIDVYASDREGSAADNPEGELELTVDARLAE